MGARCGSLLGRRHVREERGICLAAFAEIGFEIGDFELEGFENALESITGRGIVDWPPIDRPQECEHPVNNWWFATSACLAGQTGVRLRMTDCDDLHRAALEMIRATSGGDTWERLLAHFPRLRVFLAGGALRDMLLSGKREAKDLDIFLTGPDIDAALGKLANEGAMQYGPFGSPRWFPSKGSDFYCDVIPAPRFFNGLWQCEDIVDVLNQFDFTVNAVALDLRTGLFHDPQNGRRDIAKKEMRAVRFDYPEEPITPDAGLTRPAVVWFRILHYATTLGLKVEAVTLNWLREHQHYEAQADHFESLFFSLNPNFKTALAARGVDAE